MNKKFRLQFYVPVVKEKKTKHGTEIPVRYHVKGMMQTIKRMMPSENLQSMLDEYAKFYMLDKAGVEVYPLER